MASIESRVSAAAFKVTNPDASIRSRALRTILTKTSSSLLEPHLLSTLEVEGGTHVPTSIVNGIELIVLDAPAPNPNTDAGGEGYEDDLAVALTLLDAIVSDPLR